MRQIKPGLMLATALLVGALGIMPSYPAQAASTKMEAFEIPSSMGIKMLPIDKGTFKMGSPADEPGRSNDEKQHSVTISRPFFMSETEITQEQYIPVVMPDYKPFFTPAQGLPEAHSGGPFQTISLRIVDPAKYPMSGVAWDKAVEFCNKITERERAAGRLPDGYVYRLPTEAEWEYACRAGATGRFNNEGSIKDFCVGPYLDLTSPVKEGRKPNNWGLYDMHGNVYEWCMDWYGPYSDSATDPAGPNSGERRVARGGCYLSGKLDGRTPNPDGDQLCLRCAYRGKFQPDFPLGIIGFRIVMGPELSKSN